MRKVLIVVLGLTVTANAQIQFGGSDVSDAENVLRFDTSTKLSAGKDTAPSEAEGLTETSAIVIDITTDNCQVYIVSGDSTSDEGRWFARPAVMNTTCTRLLPEPMTIALLGLAGLLFRRREGTRPSTGVSIIAAR
jgi:hypothetical protein